jgi:hypothetical protein
MMQESVVAQKLFAQVFQAQREQTIVPIQKPSYSIAKESSLVQQVLQKSSLYGDQQHGLGSGHAQISSMLENNKSVPVSVVGLTPSPVPWNAAAAGAAAAPWGSQWGSAGDAMGEESSGRSRNKRRLEILKELGVIEGKR